MAWLGVDLVVVRVRDLRAAEAFYAGRFGVPVRAAVLPTARTLHLAGGPHVELAERDRRGDCGAAPRAELRMVVDDLEATYRAFPERGVAVPRPPALTPAGAREMTALDLDGSVAADETGCDSIE